MTLRLLVTFFRYNYGANASEKLRRLLQIKKITTNAPCVL